MISVSISINANAIITRSARNTMKKAKNGKTIYIVDDGSKVLHDPNEGAIVLAKLLLDTVKPL